MTNWQQIADMHDGRRALALAMLNQAPAPERKEDPVVARIREMSKSFILPPIDPKIEAEIEAGKATEEDEFDAYIKKCNEERNQK